jgi:hypothetical protein
MSIAVLVVALLGIIMASLFALWKLYSIMQRIDRKLTLILGKQPSDKINDADDRSN